MALQEVGALLSEAALMLSLVASKLLTDLNRITLAIADFEELRAPAALDRPCGLALAEQVFAWCGAFFNLSEKTMG